MQNAGGKSAKQAVEAFTSFSVKLFPKPSFCELGVSTEPPAEGTRTLPTNKWWQIVTCASWEGKGEIHG